MNQVTYEIIKPRMLLYLTQVINSLIDLGYKKVSTPITEQIINYVFKMGKTYI